MSPQTLFDQMNESQETALPSMPAAMKRSRQLLEPRIFSVSEFYEYLNGLISLEEVIVEGEISKLEVFKGYLVYFSLNDEQSVLPCLMYRNKLDVLGLPLEALAVGSRIQIVGFPNMYAKRGEFKLMVEKISLIGEGALKKAFELLKKKLEAEGLFSKEVKRPIPQYPERIGLITSRGAAAYTDFVKVLHERWGGMKVYFYPASVQGETAVQEIMRALEYFNTSVPYLDAIVLTRGGGSLEDLAAFNAESVVRSVRASKWPIICAVGHERDESLAELAADLRCSTPSNAAQLLVCTRQEEQAYLQNWQKKIILHMEQLLTAEKQYFERGLTIMERFFQKPKTELVAVAQQLDSVVGLWFSHMKQDLAQRERLLNSFDPSAVLKRGYSITATAAGNVIKSIEQVVHGDKVATTLYKGKFESTIVKKL